MSVLCQVSHQIFNRYEPTAYNFSVAVLGLAITALTYALQINHLSALDAVIQSASAIIIYLAVLSLSILFYRLVSPRHPLHAVPGPLLARSSQLWLTYQVFAGQPRKAIQAAHQRYGDVIRIGMNTRQSLLTAGR